MAADCLALDLQEGILPGLDIANRKLHQMTNVGQNVGQNTLQVRAVSRHAAWYMHGHPAAGLDCPEAQVAPICTIHAPCCMLCCAAGCS